MRRKQMSGVLDWFRSKKPASENRLPILRPEERGMIYVGPTGEAKTHLPALPVEKKPKKSIKAQLLSLFEAMEPGQSRLPEIAKSLDIIPEGIKASPPRELTPTEESAEKEVWGQLFEESPDESGSMFDMFEGTPVADVITPAQVERFTREPSRPEHADWTTGGPPLYWPTPWRIPNAFTVAHELQNSEKWDLPGLFEFTLQNTEYPGWKKEVRESAHTGEPAVLEIDQVAHWSTAYEDLANLLGIPQVVVDRYFSEIRSENEGAERAMLFEQEVLIPYLDNISRALDALRPRELRGFYVIEPAEDLSWWITYKEGSYPLG